MYAHPLFLKYNFCQTKGTLLISKKSVQLSSSILRLGSSPLDANLPYADDFHPSNELDVPVLNSEAATNTDKGSNKSADCRNNAEYEYNRILSDINDKHREEEEINAILQDWKLLAQKVDYILFWVFLALTTISSCIFIFILPYYKRGKLL